MNAEKKNELKLCANQRYLREIEKSILSLVDFRYSMNIIHNFYFFFTSATLSTSFLFSFFFLFSPLFWRGAGGEVSAQTPKQWSKLGDEAATDGDFYGASIYYKNAISIDSADLPLLYKYSESLKKYNEYELAEKYYQKIYNLLLVSPQGEDGRGAFPECLFWLATMQKFNGNYENAKDNFKLFDKTNKDKSSYYAKKAKQEIKSCEFAKKLIQDSVHVRIRNAGNLLNSFNSELSAISVNDSTIYFSSLRPDTTSDKKELSAQNYRMKIFSGSKSNETWEIKNPLDTIFNSPGFHTANGSFSIDKNRFYFARCDNNFKCSIYMSELKNNQWETAVKLENGINMDGYTSTQPMIARIEGDEVMFFVSDMPGGKGKLDVWTTNLSEMRKGKKIIKPKNLSKINTIDNDISPFYDSKDSTLYFSSEWYYGLGGFDIFKCKGNEKTFESPENIGYPYNTSVNDIYFSFYPETNSGFLTSNRKGSYTQKGETCCNDIYEYDFPKEKKKDSLFVEAKKYTSLEMLNKYLPVTLYFHNDEPNPRSWDTLTSLNYMKTYHDYIAMIETYKEEYSKGLNDSAKSKAKDDIEKFFSDYAEKGVTDLELFSELLLKELQKGEKIELTVKGYASPLAKTDYNVNLTLRRISSMQNYLEESNEGVYVPYLNKTAANGGSLDIVKIPFGEYKSDTTVSDNLNDQRNSVYSRKAALERKIEIISVSQANKDSIYPEIIFNEEIYDFGTIKQGEIVSHKFNFKNTGKDTLQILNVETSCGCTVASYTKIPIIPGSDGEVETSFNSSGKSGKVVKTITLETNANPKIRVLHITAEIVVE